MPSSLQVTVPTDEPSRHALVPPLLPSISTEATTKARRHGASSCHGLTKHRYTRQACTDLPDVLSLHSLSLLALPSCDEAGSMWIGADGAVELFSSKHFFAPVGMGLVTTRTNHLRMTEYALRCHASVFKRNSCPLRGPRCPCLTCEACKHGTTNCGKLSRG